MIQQTIGVLRESLERELVGMRLGAFAKADLIDHAKAFPREAARRRLPVGIGEFLPCRRMTVWPLKRSGSATIYAMRSAWLWLSSS
jgi:hypothetical protein